jgi:hypothetical protein
VLKESKSRPDGGYIIVILEYFSASRAAGGTTLRQVCPVAGGSQMRAKPGGRNSFFSYALMRRFKIAQALLRSKLYLSEQSALLGSAGFVPPTGLYEAHLHSCFTPVIGR